MPPSEIELLRKEVQEMRDEIARNKKQMDWLMEGHVSSKNIREVGGYNVNQTDLVSKDGNVGLSSANDSADPIRIYAGGTDKNTAPFRVPQSGHAHMTGATIESQAGYPKFVIDPNGNIVGAYFSPGQYVSMYPVGSTGTAQLTFRDEATVPPSSSFMWTQNDSWAVGVASFTITSTKFIRLSPGGTSPFTGNAWLLCDGDLHLFDFDDLYSITDGKNLQQALDAKANAFSGFTGTIFVASSSGGSPTTAKNFVNGVCTS